MSRLIVPTREAAPAASQPLLVAVVAVNVLTNFVDDVACTDIDFPVVRVAEAA